MNTKFKTIFWLSADYTLLFISYYFVYINKLFVIRNLMMAMALTRCQYQQHDFAHGQFNKLQIFNNNIMKNAFLLTTGISIEYWNNEEHMPHHINVNNFELDPDDFETKISSKYKLCLFFISQIMSIQSLIYLLKNKFYTSACINTLFLLKMYIFMYYYFYDFLLFNFFYLFTFGLTQWFHHPKIYIYDSNVIRRQVLNSRNIRGHNFFINYWMGGHDYQIEHHLYPKMSRYELPFMSKKIKDKYFDIYQEISVCDGIMELACFLIYGRLQCPKV
jgi:fatty acid desaturase